MAYGFNDDKSKSPRRNIINSYTVADGGENIRDVLVKLFTGVASLLDVEGQECAVIQEGNSSAYIFREGYRSLSPASVTVEISFTNFFSQDNSLIATTFRIYTESRSGGERAVLQACYRFIASRSYGSGEVTISAITDAQITVPAGTTFYLVENNY